MCHSDDVLAGVCLRMPLSMQRHRAAFRGVRDGEEQDKMGRSKKVESKERREEE